MISLGTGSLVEPAYPAESYLSLGITLPDVEGFTLYDDNGPHATYVQGSVFTEEPGIPKIIGQWDYSGGLLRQYFLVAEIEPITTS